MVAVASIITANTMIGPLLVGISRDLGVSVGQAGLLAAVTAVPQALTSPISGLVSDRLGRRPMIVFSLASLGVLSLAATVAPSFAALAATRFVSGLVGSLAPISLLAAVGEIFPPDRVVRGMGWFNLGFSIAAIAGVPLMAAIAGASGWRAAFGTIGVVLLATALGFRLWFPAIPTRSTTGSVLATYRALWGIDGLLLVLAANLVERSLFVMTTIYLPAFLMLDYRMTAATVAPAIALVALGSLGGNVLGGWLGNRCRQPALFAVSQVVAGLLGLVVFGAGLALPVAVGLATVFALANASSRPAFLAYSTNLAPGSRGALLGFVALSNQGGFIAGSVVGAAAIGREGHAGLPLAALTQGVLAAGLALPLLRRGAPAES